MIDLDKENNFNEFNNKCDLKNILDSFSIGLIILEKENEKDYKIKIVNSYLIKLFDLPKSLDINVFKERLQEYKILLNDKLSDINLEKIVFDDKYISQYKVGTFISSISMIYVKIHILKNKICICIDNYSDERKDIKTNLIKSLKYQYIVTLYHELNNPLNALQNLIEENNNNSDEEMMIENKIQNFEIKLLVNLIQVFIKNFIWYFRLIFELSNNTIVNFDKKLNLEYEFNRILNQFSILLKYKEIQYSNDLSFLNDKYIESNETYLINFIRGIFILLYHKIPKNNGFEIKYNIKSNNQIELIFEKTKQDLNYYQRRRSKMINDIDFKYKQEFDFSKTIQTEEITKELLNTMSKVLKLKLKIFEEEEDENKILILIIPFTIEKDDIEILDELSEKQKLNIFESINRQLFINDNSEDNNKEKLINIDSFPILQTQLPYYNIAINDFDENKNKLECNSIFNDSLIKENNKYKNFFFFKKKNDSIASLNSDFSIEKSIKSKKKNFLPGELNSFNGDLYKPNNINNFNNFLHYNKNTKRSLIYNNEINNNLNEISLNYNHIKITNHNSTREKFNDSKEQTTRLSTLEKNCNCKDIILCDDESFNLSTIKNMLKKFKIECDLSTNGKECIDLILNKKKSNCHCKKKYYKLIFLDMMMPIMNGLETAKKIQSMIDNNEINNLKIIIISAHIEENLIIELKNIKCIVETVNKPLKKTKLEELLKMYYL